MEPVNHPTTTRLRPFRNTAAYLLPLRLQIINIRKSFCKFASLISAECREIRSSDTGFNLNASLLGHDAVSVRTDRW